MFREEPQPDLPTSGYLKRFKAWCKKHSTDLLLIAVLSIVFFSVNSIGHPYKRYITKDDLYRHLHHPRKADTVPPKFLPLISLVIPSAVVLSVSLWRRDASDLSPGLLGLLTAVFLTSLVTDVLKNGIGRPRPDFFYRCFPEGIAVFAPNGDVACTGDPHIVTEGRKSFPSGHTSLASVGMMYIALYVGSKLGCFDRRGQIWKLIVASLPLWFAGFVGVSRISDYRHHWQDVLVGACIGGCSAFICFRRHYPVVAFSSKSFIRVPAPENLDV